MTIRDYILARTGEAGGEVEGVEFAYSTSSGRSGVGEAVPGASRVTAGPAEWFSGKTGGGLGLLPLLPFLGSGGSPEGMEEAYNEAYGENAAQAAEAAEAAGEVKAASGQRVKKAEEKADTKPQSTEQIQKQEVIVPDYIEKHTAQPEALQTSNVYLPLSEQIKRISQGTYVGQTLDTSREYPDAQTIETIDVNRIYPEAQQIETLDISKEYPEAQRMETLDISKTYPEAQRMEEKETFQSSGSGSSWEDPSLYGKSFGEPLSYREWEVERAKRIADNPNENLLKRAFYQKAYNMETSPAKEVGGELAAWSLAPVGIAGLSSLGSTASAALASGVASIPTAVQLGAENAGNTISQAVPKLAETVQKASNVVNFSDLAKKATGIAAGIGGVISSLGAAAESSAISSPGTSGNWDAAEQKVKGSTATLKTTAVKSAGTSTKSANVTTKISKVL